MKKLTYLFTIAAMALSLGACTDEEPKYTPATAVEELPVYFSYEDKTSYDLFENSTEIDVPIYRKSANGELTIPVTTSATPDADGFTFPASVTFADGDTEAHIIVPLDMTKIKGRVDYNVTFSVEDGVVTPYYTDKITYTLNYSPWDLVTSEDGTVTKALYRDDLVAPMYGLDVVEYEVEMQSNPENPNIIRLVNPYGEAWPYYQDGFSDGKDHYMYFNITNPNMVFLCDSEGVALGTGGDEDFFFHTGLTLDEDGEILITTYYNVYAYNDRKAPEETYGTLAKGNLTYQERQMFVAFADYDPLDHLYYANTNSQFRIIWPGAEEYVDPATVWNIIGEGQFTDGMFYPLAVMEEAVDELPAECTYNVEVAQFGGDPNMYRIMNPWKSGVCPYGLDYTGDKYIELDATNPDCVLMDLQSTGINFTGLGTLYFMNYGTFLIANRDYTEQQVIDAGLNDTFKDGVIYSAPGNLLWGFPSASGGISLNQGEYEWQLVMPNASTEVKAKAPAKHFNGNGPTTPVLKAKNNPRWAVSAPVFSEMTKSIKR